jgi:hypothetical protein
MKNKKYSLILFLILFSNPIYSQFNTEQGLKMSLYFGRKFKCLVAYNLNISYGIPVNSIESHAIVPFVDLKFSVNRNHLGSSVLHKLDKGIDGNISCTTGGYYASNKIEVDEDYNYIPIFSPSMISAFSSTYRTNIGAGSTFLYQFSTYGKKRTAIQSIGNVFVSIDNFYFNYYNDGGPVLGWFGDKNDRYWTGGLTAGYIFDREHQFEISFEKYTGFIKDAFEATNLLFVDNVVYDSDQFRRNSGRLAFNYTNNKLDAGISANIWNFKFDLQDWIHRNITNNPYHYKLEKTYFDFEIYKIYRL